MPLNILGRHYAMENPASIYDEESMTALELAGRTAAKVNETVEAFNKLENNTLERLEKIPENVENAVEVHIENGEFDKQIDEYAGNMEGLVEATKQSLNARMDAFTTLPAGSTSGNAELIDGRVGEMGGQFTNIGQHIRTNFKLLRDRNLPDVVKHLNAYSLRNNDLTGRTDATRLGFEVNKYVKELCKVKATKGYKVNVTYWEGWPYPETIFYDTGWVDEVTISPDIDLMITIRRDPDGQNIGLDEAYALEYFDGHWHKHKYGNVLDTILPLFAHGSFTVDNPNYIDWRIDTRFATRSLIKVDKPEVLYTSNGCKASVHYFNSDKMTPENFAYETGWCDEVELVPDTYFMVYFHNPAAARQELEHLEFLHAKPVIKVVNNGEGVAVGIPEGVSFHRCNSAVNDPVIKSIAHRGNCASSTCTENTYANFTEAIENGYKYLETDVRVTKDGVPVLFHDETMSRLTKNTLNRSVSEYNYAEIELESLTESGKPRVDVICTLALLLTQAAKSENLHFYLELQNSTDNYLRVIHETVDSMCCKDRVTWISFNVERLKKMLEIDPQARIGLNVDSVTLENVEAAKALKTPYNDVFINVNLDNLNTNAYHLAKNNGLYLEAWYGSFNFEDQDALMVALSKVVNMDANTGAILGFYAKGLTCDNLEIGAMLRGE